MYSLLLVDDEEAVIASIKNSISWNDYGFEEPKIASNGLEALEIVDDCIPDAIITDIKMPYMSGIELTEKIRQEYSSTIQIVILSGYDEFTFAQEAVRLKVSEYVLKPVTVKSMEGLLKRIKKRIEENKERIKLIENSSNLYKEAFSLYKERFLISLITAKNKKIDERALIEKASTFDIPLQSNLFLVVTMESQDMISTPLALEEVIKENFDDSSNIHPIIFQYENQIILLFSSAMTNDFITLFKRQIYRTLTILKESLSHYFEYKWHIGVGRVVESISEIPHSYDSAIEALNYVTLYPEQYIIDVQDIKSIEHETNSVSFGELKSELVLAIKFGTKDDVIKSVHHSFSAILGNGGDIQSAALFIIGNISETWLLYSNTLSDLLVEENIFMELALVKSLSIGEKVCTALAIKANEKASGTREISHIEFVENAKKIIRKRYPETTFGLDSLCEEISVSPAYFSTTFKKETGISFVQFLTNTRIEKAKELLKNSEYKTYEIAEKVGFAETNYFSFTFKKNVGVSPSQYRSQARK